MIRRSAHARIVVPFLLLASACGGQAEDGTPRMVWQPVADLEETLPEGIRVYEGTDRSLPVKAWYVRVDEADEGLNTRVVASEDTDGKETVSSFADRLGADVVVNGGYFRMDLFPSRHVGLLHIEGRSISEATLSVLRDTLRYPVARGSLGLGGERLVDVAWVRSRDDSLFEFDEPPANMPGRPVDPLHLEGARHWPVRDAVAAGPVLLSDGRVAVATEPEAFFGSSIPEVHPRTAAGYTRRGELILMVVDGRQPASRGVSLEELAGMMRQLGCVEAVNLDGGGSSALVVGGRLLNRPAGGVIEREVVSAIAVFSSPPGEGDGRP